MSSTNKHEHVPPHVGAGNKPTKRPIGPVKSEKQIEAERGRLNPIKPQGTRDRPDHIVLRK